MTKREKCVFYAQNSTTLDSSKNKIGKRNMLMKPFDSRIRYFAKKQHNKNEIAIPYVDIQNCDSKFPFHPQKRFSDGSKTSTACLLCFTQDHRPHTKVLGHIHRIS